MRTMTWGEIERDWSGLQKKHRLEIAQAVARYCIGHKVNDVAEKLGFSYSWTIKQLDYAGMGEALGGVGNFQTPPGKSGDKGVDHAVSKVVSQFKPNVNVKLADDGEGKQSVVNIEGKDAADFEPYLDHYVREGHEPAAATRLAKAEWAAEAAVDAGVIAEGTNKRNEKVNRILFPTKDADGFDLDLKSHMNKVRHAAKFLDNAKVNLLRRKSTCEKVTQANAEWIVQIERIRNFHPTFVEEV